MAEFTIQVPKNRITDRIHENRSRSITGVDLQEILHDIVDSLAGQSGGETGSSASLMTDYGLVGAVNGVNKSFSTSIHYLAATTRVYLNGVRQFLGEDYFEDGLGVIRFAFAPFAGDHIIADYQY
jgi:hypothetical protein